MLPDSRWLKNESFDPALLGALNEERQIELFDANKEDEFSAESSSEDAYIILDEVDHRNESYDTLLMTELHNVHVRQRQHGVQVLNSNQFEENVVHSTDIYEPVELSVGQAHVMGKRKRPDPNDHITEHNRPRLSKLRKIIKKVGEIVRLRGEIAEVCLTELLSVIYFELGRSS